VIRCQNYTPEIPPGGSSRELMRSQLEDTASPHPVYTPLKDANDHVVSVKSEKLALVTVIQHVEKTILQLPTHVFLPESKFQGDDLENQLLVYTLRPMRSSSSWTSSTISTHDYTMNRSQTRPSSLAERSIILYHALKWRNFTTYYRLFTVVIMANIGVFVYVNCQLIRAIARSFNEPTLMYRLTGMLTAVSGNLTTAIALRNEHVINLLYRIFVVHVPPTAPLGIRQMIAKVYCFGGIHSGTGLMATLWYTAFTSWTIYVSIQKRSQSLPMDRANLALTGLNWFLFVAIVTAAHPRVRSYMHDYFETSHRVCGWLLLASFWVQTVLFCVANAMRRHVDFGKNLVKVPTFWMLVLMTALVIYPWVRAKHNFKVEVEKLSSHATRIYFEDKAIMPPCRVIRISDNICRETHAFATIPEPNGMPGFSIIVSNAGDWTRRTIENPPKHLSIKGSPTWGVLRIATMFSPVVIVATGSGIGPCLGLFSGCHNLRCRVLWSTKSPESTYGKKVVNAVMRADPKAQIYDSSIHGRIELAPLAYRLYQESQAEAVIVISNKVITYSVIQELERHSVPAFGPIWDS
jgi:hypothetical protein